MSAALAVTAVVLLVGSSACNSTPDLNPSLGAYQDERSCFPFKSNLHQIYRNFESDPYFGGEAKCLRTGPTGPLVDSPLNTTFEYGSDGKINFLTTITSSPGYTAGNVVHLQPLDESLEAFNFTVAYRDCQRCKVFRHSYIENGAGCSFWVTDEALGDEGTCCEFVYELLCGTSPKYQIYNESCQ
ncbi:uncharacterized protein LOC144119046 isoform X1 [Amblyomma americanum]